MPSDPSWDDSTEAWIAFAESDVNRLFLLDPVMLEVCGDVRDKAVLDVGCGEGRFCRMLASRGAKVTGVDPTERLIEEARMLDSNGRHVVAGGEALPFPNRSFDLVVSYVTLVDIADFRAAI